MLRDWRRRRRRRRRESCRDVCLENLEFELRTDILPAQAGTAAPRHLYIMHHGIHQCTEDQRERYAN